MWVLILCLIGACWYGFTKSVWATSLILAGVVVGAIVAIGSGIVALFFLPFIGCLVAAILHLLAADAEKPPKISESRFQLVQHVFFSESGNPIVGIEKWIGTTDFKNNLMFHPQNAIKNEGLPSSVSINFMDVVCVTVEREVEKSDLGKTLGRMAAAGLASGLIGHSVGARVGQAGLGGAVAEFAFRGADKRSEYQGSIAFVDGSIVTFYLPQSDAERLCDAVPSAATTDEAVQKALDLLQFFKEMADEGELGITETIQTLVSLKKEKDATITRLEEASSIAERKEIRVELGTIEHQIQINRNCLRYIAHRSGENIRDFLARHQAGDVANLGTAAFVS